VVGLWKRLRGIPAPGQVETTRAAPLSIRTHRGRVDARRARSALLWLLALITLSHVGFWLGLEFTLPELRDPEYGRRLRSLQQIVKERPGRPLVLVLGSSRVVMGLRPDVLPDAPGEPIVFNAGRVGAGPLMQDLLLRRYLDAGISPAAVVVEVWPQLFNGKELDRIEPGRLRLEEVARLGERGDARRWREALASSFSPWADHRFDLMNRLLPKWTAQGDSARRQTVGWTWLTLDRWGWLPMPRNPEQEGLPRAQLIERMRTLYQPVLQDLHLDEQVQADYRSLLALCRDRRIPVVLLFMPESSEFRGFYGPGTWQRFEKFVQGLREEFGLELIDARAAIPDSYLPDGHHLSPAGAAAFTHWLGREGLGPWLRRHRAQGE
jgi:hypothetical protein